MYYRCIRSVLANVQIQPNTTADTTSKRNTESVIQISSFLVLTNMYYCCISTVLVNTLIQEKILKLQHELSVTSKGKKSDCFAGLRMAVTDSM